jgi:putative endonuclease
MAYFVYILECADKTYYAGSTNDLDRRLNQHNHQKTGARYTRARRPAAIVYFEECIDISAARKRECEIKKMTRKEKETLVNDGKPKIPFAN